ncbi:subtilase-type protease inhibitor [Streptomyces sp. NPDC055085]
MPYIARTVAVAAAAASLLSIAGIAQAVPMAKADDSAESPAPSVLVLTVGKPAGRDVVTVSQAVTLDCTQEPAGTHPNAGQACAELEAVDAQFTQLGDGSGPQLCNRLWAPVTLGASGVWKGKPVSWSKTYSNSCMLQADMSGSTVFDLYR